MSNAFERRLAAEAARDDELTYLRAVEKAAREVIQEPFVDVWSMPERDLTVAELRLRNLLKDRAPTT